MKKRTFGNSGLEVSEIGFGAWAIGGSWGEQSDKDSHLGLETALDRGVNFIDTAAGICMHQDTSCTREMAPFTLL